MAFSTNLNPASLADEAFMRRIQTKIKVTYATDEEFHEITRRVCTMSGLVYDATIVDGFIKVLAELRQPLRGCYPRDIIHHICWKAKYEEVQPQLTLEAIREACDSYFLRPETDLESGVSSAACGPRVVSCGGGAIIVPGPAALCHRQSCPSQSFYAAGAALRKICPAIAGQGGVRGLAPAC